MCLYIFLYILINKVYNNIVLDRMEPGQVSESMSLESVFPFLHTNEWKVLVEIFEYYVRDANKTNIRKAARFWTEQRRLQHEGAHYAWEEIITKLDGIRQAMWDIQGYIANPTSRHIPSLMRTKCDAISETIVTIVHDYTYMHEGFTRYLHDQGYMTVKMKYFRQGPNGLWGGVHVKCGKLFGGVQDLHLLSFLHRIYEVFLLPPDPDPEGYFNRYPRLRCTWPEIATIPENFRYRERPNAMLIQNPDGTPSVAMPVQRDDRLEEHSMQSDSSGDERDDDDDVVTSSMSTWHIGHDSDDEYDPVVAGSRRVIRLDPDRDSQLTTKLLRLKQLSLTQ